MRIVPALTMAAFIASTIGSVPAFADPGKGKGHGKKAKHQQHRVEARRDAPRALYIADCPPGLAKKSPRCVPPGQAKKHAINYGKRKGDVLRVGDYVRVDDLWRYGLQPRRDWSYYRDDGRIYRIDSGTRKILAVMNLIDAFTN